MVASFYNNKNKALFACGILFLSIIVFFSTTVPPASNAKSSEVSTVVAMKYSSAEMDLAKIINKHSKKTTWNEAQKKASKIVNLVMTGSDIAGAISIVLGFLSFGVITAITWTARISLKWYIKKKGKRAAVQW